MMICRLPIINHCMGVYVVVSMTFFTPDFFSYEQVWETVDHRRGVTFGVTACSDVHVVLSNAVRNISAGVYDIVIGGWVNTQ